MIAPRGSVLLGDRRSVMRTASLALAAARIGRASLVICRRRLAVQLKQKRSCEGLRAEHAVLTKIIREPRLVIRMSGPLLAVLEAAGVAEGRTATPAKAGGLCQAAHGRAQSGGGSTEQIQGAARELNFPSR